MIKIGNTLINPAEISAIYPSESTPGKVWISLRSGRTVWTMASMEEVTKALLDAGELENDMPPDQVEQLNMLLQLYAEGYRYIARDENGQLFAYEAVPYKDEACWCVRDGNTKPLDSGPFIGVQWEDDEPEDIIFALHSYGIEAAFV